MRGGYATRRRPRSNMPKASVTNVLLAITAAIYGAQWLVPGITMQGAKITSKIMRGQWYRLVTPIFLHANLAHLLMNSMSLYNIGPFVEQWFGKRRMLSIYVLSGVSGVLASCYWNPRASSVGASGAIFGMVGAAACFFASNRNELGAGADRGLQSILRTVVINTIMGLQISQIDNAGHAGGFVAGFVLTYLFGPNMRWVGSPYSGPRLVDVPRVSLAGMQGDLSRFRRRLSGRQ
ncbi:hypothetical protein JKP88DRAFT_219036 [Tribonema minus]|uniref:Peptidase S54 rhomboid domain-containing protein n=1 Tax=Tribonema minus TaxID=303371 RepID=A0A835Z1Q0_9STRA|nr:hypothetical protein JKP88DRAFT_219036 [Tribonema minus]